MLRDVTGLRPGGVRLLSVLVFVFVEGGEFIETLAFFESPLTYLWLALVVDTAGTFFYTLAASLVDPLLVTVAALLQPLCVVIFQSTLFGSPPPGRSRATRRPATVGGGAKPAALERPRCHSSWRFPAERVRGPLLGSPSRFRPQTTSASYERTRRRAPHAFEVTELIESLRRPHAEPTPEEALRTLVRDRVARAYTGCWDACRGLDEGWAASRVLANVDHARLATRGWRPSAARRADMSSSLTCCCSTAS